MSGGLMAPVFGISARALHHRLQQPEPVLLLDVRCADSLAHQPFGIRSAVPVILKEGGPDLPDVDRDHEIVIYDSGDDETDSDQVTRWLSEAGYRRLWRLEGGLSAWRSANLPVWQVRFGTRHRGDLNWTPLRRMTPQRAVRAADDAAGFLRGMALPLRREVAVLRVGVIETTASPPPSDIALARTQQLMACVVSTAARHPAELHDFEGDGTALYFAEIGGVLRAAFELRQKLCAARRARSDVPLVRLSLDTSPMTLGHASPQATGLRCLIGSCIQTAERILKQAPPGGIVATARVVKVGQVAEPALIARFSRMPNRLHVRNAEQSLPVFLSLPDAAELEPAHVAPDPDAPV